MGQILAIACPLAFGRAQQVVNAANRVEQLGRTRDPHEAAGAIANVQAELTRLTPVLQDYLNANLQAV